VTPVTAQTMVRMPATRANETVVLDAVSAVMAAHYERGGCRDIRTTAYRRPSMRAIREGRSPPSRHVPHRDVDPCGDLELREDVPDVRLDRSLGEVELSRDLPVAPSGRDEARDLE